MVKKNVECLQPWLYSFFILFSVSSLLQADSAKKGVKEICEPDIMMVFVVDQFAKHHVNGKLNPHLKAGLHTLLTQGISYESAFHPHGLPCTATGHAGLSNGCCAKDHGIVDNEMYDPVTGVIRPSDQGSDKIKSSKMLMVDNLVDQFMVTPRPGKIHHAFSLSLKSRAAIMMGGKRGKVVWFNTEAGEFDSSPAYYQRLPDWLTRFNAKNRISTRQSMIWEPCYPSQSVAYHFDDIDNYDYAVIPKLINRSFFIELEEKSPYELFLKTPFAQQKLLDLAKACIDAHYKTPGQDRILIYVSLSGLDMVGHMFGPDSRECIDMLYYLDHQLDPLIKHVQKITKNKAMFVITGDHGIMPIPELLQKKGLTSAQRIMAKPLIAKMNAEVERKFGVNDVVELYQPPYFSMNKSIFNKLEKEEQKSILKFLKKWLKKQPGFANAWLTKDLEKGSFNKRSLEYNFQQQIYPGRCGDIVCLTNPYVMLTNYDKGTSHATPYAYDTQVPLALYWPGYIDKKQICDVVSMQQLPVTLAHILKIQKPSASMFKPLPGVFGK